MGRTTGRNMLQLGMISLLPLLGLTLCSSQTFTPDHELRSTANAWFDKKIVAEHTCVQNADVCKFANEREDDWWEKRDSENWMRINKMSRDFLVEILYQESSRHELSAQELNTCRAFRYPKVSPSNPFTEYLQEKPHHWSPNEVSAYRSLPHWFQMDVEYALWKRRQREAWESWHSLGISCDEAKGDFSINFFNQWLSQEDQTHPIARWFLGEEGIEDVSDWFKIDPLPAPTGRPSDHDLDRRIYQGDGRKARTLDWVQDNDSSQRTPTPTPTATPSPSAHPSESGRGNGPDRNQGRTESIGMKDQGKTIRDPPDIVSKAK